MEKQTIYKLYKDINVKPTKDLYLEPLFVGSLLGVGTILSMSPSVEKLVSVILTGGTVYLLSKGLKEKATYNDKLNRYELAENKLKEINEAINKKLGYNFDLSFDNVEITVTNKDEDGLITTSNIFYGDGSYLQETYVDDEYDCGLYKRTDETIEKINLTDVVAPILKK